MSLAWFRMDNNIATHDKIIGLLNDPHGQRFRAAFSYVCALGHSAGHGTDGHINPAELPFVWGTKATADLLIRYDLWIPNGHGWEIKNYALRQELSEAAQAKREIASEAGRRGNCLRWHGPDCWTDGHGCSHDT